MSDEHDHRWRRRRRIGLVVGILLLMMGGLAGFRLLSISADLRTARDHIDAAALALEDGRLADARSQLAQAQGLLIDANGTLHTAPELQIAGLFPVASQNVRAVEDTVEVALQLSSGGLRLLTTAQALESPNGTMEIPFRSGEVPLDVVQQAQVDLAQLGASLRLPSGFAEPSLLVYDGITDAQVRIEREVLRRQPQIANLEHGLALVSELLGGNGDRRYVIVVANTAEMRGSGGMYLSYGVLESSGGDIDLVSFGGIDDLALAAPLDPAALQIPDDELARWQGLEPSLLWRSANLVPDFSVVAPRVLAMYEAATGLPADGVVQIDPVGLGAILAGVGPVVVEEVGEVTAANVESLTLNEAYSVFPDRDQRQEVLGDVAEAAFDRLVNGEYESLRPLATALADATASHHLLFHSVRPSASVPMLFFDTAGTLPDGQVTDSFLLTTQNFGRDKLDFYLDTAVVVRGSRPELVAGTLEIDVTVTNTAPPGQTEPEYVFGGNFGRDVELGTYTGLVSLYVPNGTTVTSTSGTDGVAPLVQAENGRTAIGWSVAVEAGGSATVHLVVALPPRSAGVYEIGLGPIPRVRETTWDVRVDDGADAVAVRSGPLVLDEVVSAG